MASNGGTSPLAKGVAGALAAYVALQALDAKTNILFDLSFGRKMLGLKGRINSKYTEGYNVVQMFADTLAKQPKKTAITFLSDEPGVPPRSVTYADIERLSNQFAAFYTKQGLTKGDTAALFMENRPEFIISWLGMAKLGVKVAMINTSIKMNGLVHCIKISGAKVLIYGAELDGPVSEVHKELEALGLRIYSQGGDKTSFPSADAVIATMPADKISRDITKNIGMMDPFGYIYTSGTTGLPKAAVILHAKMYAFGQLLATAYDITPDDVVYTTLPLFHSAGGGLGGALMLGHGCTMILRKKFSASVFFEDCGKHKITVVQYIGELCRYLLQRKPSPSDRQHKVRLAVGNGLRPEIWDEFQTRFNIPEIGEFYGSTEGNGALVNHCTTKDAQGKCGRLGSVLRKVMGVVIVKFDVDNESIIRDKATGFATECDYDEPGELLMQIKATDPSTTFAGYESKEATEKKIARDVFTKGDAFFRTGDLLSVDHLGYYSFRDRIGDTFRWKGENCSTAEVASEVSAFKGIQECNVYGVLVPNNHDGRAPMAAITPTGGKMENLDLKGLLQHCQKVLPRYAIPLFLRITPEIEVTATLKHQKGDLRKQGIDIAAVSDPLFWLNPQTNQYEPFGVKEFAIVTKPGAKL